MMESQLFLTYFGIMLVFLMSCLSESFLSEIPEKASERFLSEVFLPKVFDFNVIALHFEEKQIRFRSQQTLKRRASEEAT